MWLGGLFLLLAITHNGVADPPVSCVFSAPLAFCNFDNGVCDGWSGGNTKMSTMRNSTVLYLTDGGSVESEDWACSIGSSNHCLSFDYLLFLGVGATSETISVEFTWRYGPQGNPTIVPSLPLIFTLPVRTGWGYATLSLEYTKPDSSADFTVDLVGPQGRYGSNIGKTIHIDNLKYEKQPCSSSTSTVAPTVAATALTVPVTSFMTPTATQTATPAGNFAQPESSSNSASLPPAVTHTANPSPPETTQVETATATSTNIGPIIGAIIAVVVVVVAGVIIFIVITRRRGIQFWKSCFTKDKANTNSNNHETSMRDLNSPSSGSTIQDNEYANVSHSLGDGYSVARTNPELSASSTIAESVRYAKVNKPKHKPQPTPSVDNDGGFEEAADAPPANMAPGFEYNHLDFGKRPRVKTQKQTPTATESGSSTVKTTDNYDHIKKHHVEDKGAYSLAQPIGGNHQNNDTTERSNPNSVMYNSGAYQEPLRSGSIYHILDKEPGATGSETVGVDDTGGIYHVPDDLGEAFIGDNNEFLRANGDTNGEGASTSVYHMPDENTGYENSQHSSRYSNVADPPTTASDAAKHRFYYNQAETSTTANNAAEPQAVSVYQNKEDPSTPTTGYADNASKPSPTSVYHVLKTDPNIHGSSAGIYHVPEETSKSSSKPQPPRKLKGVIQPRGANKNDLKKQNLQPKPQASRYHSANNLEPAGKSETEAKSVYHMPGSLQDKCGGEGDGKLNSANYEVAKPMGSAIPSSIDSSNSEYHLAAPMNAHAASEPTQCGANPASQDNDYNSLDFGGRKDNLKTKVATSSDGDSGGLYSHLNEGDEDSYNLVERGRKSEYIGEYSHIPK
jgi:hypothetical protein